MVEHLPDVIDLVDGVLVGVSDETLPDGDLPRCNLDTKWLRSTFWGLRLL